MQDRNEKNRKNSTSTKGSFIENINEEKKKKKKGRKDSRDDITEEKQGPVKRTIKNKYCKKDCTEDDVMIMAPSSPITTHNYNNNDENGNDNNSDKNNNNNSNSNSTNNAGKKKRSTDELIGKNVLTEDLSVNKGDSKNEIKKKKVYKDMKYYKDIKQMKEYINMKNTNSRFTNFMRFYGYYRGAHNSSKYKTLITNQDDTNNNINSYAPKENSKSKLETFKVRFIWSCVILFFCFFILALGHFYLCILVLLSVTVVYNEIVSLKSIENKDKKLPQIFYIRWYWFILTILAWGIPWALPRLNHQFRLFKYLLKYHSINMFILAFWGFVWFILSLRKFSMRYQFSQIGIILLTSLLVVTQSLMHIANIYSGLIWFFIPVSSVVVNDTFAYIFGILFGKTQLIELSPKKTVEGFVGSSIITILWGVFATRCLQHYKYFACPQNNISFIPFYTMFTSDCEDNAIFHQKVYILPTHLSNYLPVDKIYYTKMTVHGLVLSAFAAFLAPFGGFFASGFKRALKIKDFGQTIPGHGGFTDRLDCQIFIGMFTYVYLKSFAKIKSRVHYSYDVLIDSIQKLDHKEIMRLFNQLKNMIDKKRRKTINTKINQEKFASKDPVRNDDEILS
ncbi:cytidine diphosphate-diacylglycerol synthase, putative [Plasmodium malariae]|uniref:Phosphatidate cytidylyltransferase n=1 Tax=Plasmodium malariae TaxID=5858 RepID=A0A1D3TD61_PLAMA|nr:cytidine diphosphate-diacylglycerol synthase, putative [Plasmodium malariae]SCP02838.1 cytidine diphosphate-diacylglycerol synthase, putative [Plasmodium malariae]